MKLLLVGIDHRTAPLELRERLAVAPRDLPDTLATLRTAVGIGELVLLSTCNRVECYVATSDPAATARELVERLANRSQLTADALQPHLYGRIGEEAVRHLFRVAAGLESMVLGESEIAAQVKQAYQLAHAQGATGPLLNRLFQKALHSAKVVRANTRIAEGSASIGSVVVTLARRLFGQRLPSCEVLLWGAGKAAEVTARHLVKQGVRRLSIVNRTAFKAQDLAMLCQGGWLSWEQALVHLTHVDIAIVCTQAPHYVVDADDIAQVLPHRQGRPLVIVDLAVPRNVDPAIKQRPGIHLYDIDDLQAIARGALAKRQQETERCEALIAKQVGYCWSRKAVEPKQEGVLCGSVDALLSV